MNHEYLLAIFEASHHGASHMDGGMGGMWGGWGMLLWPLIWLLVPIALILAVLYLYNNRSAQSDTAIEVLRERYARGELSEEEFDRRAAKLRAEAGTETGYSQ